MRLIYAPMIVSSLVLITGCASLSTHTAEAERQQYQRAIQDAAVIEATEIVTLPTLPAGRVRMVTWSKFPDSYPLGKPTALKWGDVWVTQDNAVKAKCRQFPAATTVTDTQKLLGLPANADEKRSFVTLEVDTQAVFRPCANPSVQEKTCSATFADNVSQQYAAWYAHQASQSYQTAGGFPWTRLGYTYNWKAGANKVGVPEFVIRKGATVTPIAAQETQAYCTP